nr:MAG TPA: hypothetical protein [Caudoviricetes sp.]
MLKSYITNRELLEAIEAMEVAELLNAGNKLQLEYNDKTAELKVLKCYVKKVDCKKMEMEG